MTKGCNGQKKMIEIVATNVLASRLRNSDRLQRQPLVLIKWVLNLKN